MSLDEHRVLRVRDGDVVGQGSWIYAWLRPGSERPVIYVGATGLHPATRTWLHLHDGDPDIGRIAARYPDAAAEDLDVVAVRVPEDVRRADARQSAIAFLDDRALLSERYVGFDRTDGPFPPAVAATAERLCIAVADHLAQAG